MKERPSNSRVLLSQEWNSSHPITCQMDISQACNLFKWKSCTHITCYDGCTMGILHVHNLFDAFDVLPQHRIINATAQGMLQSPNSGSLYRWRSGCCRWDVTDISNLFGITFRVRPPIPVRLNVSTLRFQVLPGPVPCNKMIHCCEQDNAGRQWSNLFTVTYE